MRYLIELAKGNPAGFSLLLFFAGMALLAMFTDRIETWAARSDEVRK